MIERPSEPNLCPGIDEQRPSIVICAAENLEDFSDPKLKRKLYAAPKYEWEKEKVGAGANLVKINEKYWLLNYHGKQDAEVGYTQSFMVLENVENDVNNWESVGEFDELLFM